MNTRWLGRFVLVVIVIAGGLACSKPLIVGRVEDPTGLGLAGVRVHIENSGFATETEADGKYSLPYTPGQFTVRYEKVGHTSDAIELNIQSKDEFPAKRILLFPLPPAGHVLCFNGNKTIDLQPFKLYVERWVQGALTTETYSSGSQPSATLGTPTASCIAGPQIRLRLTAPGDGGVVATVKYSMGMPMGTDYEGVEGLKMVANKEDQVMVYELALAPDFEYVLVEERPSTFGNMPTGRGFSLTTRTN